ncbi:MAG: hypothetical protein OYM47_20195 [Gemmatimonadota bacterium]|nr:hypothetical protein [Gemmatimonadota bacterium]
MARWSSPGTKSPTAAMFGLSQGDAGFDALFDLDGDGTIGFSDFLIFAASFGVSS